ncbi:hypothetical protein [Streptomyces sp. NPDC006134]|uniref:hypothetical protein n=1 Tax=Streptomyces sp. NPDC006134 TaxID=3154467 RepID=UPI003403DA15
MKTLSPSRPTGPAAVTAPPGAGGAPGPSGWGAFGGCAAALSDGGTHTGTVD